MSCKTGSATNIIYGLALGYKSAIIPVFVLAAIIFTSFQLCGTYGKWHLHVAAVWDVTLIMIGRIPAS